MFGFLYSIIGGCALVGSFFRKEIRDEEMKRLDTTDNPYWMDSAGIYHWKSNDEKINSVSWDNEGHLIIYDKKWRKIDYTMLKIERKLNDKPYLVLEYGRDPHAKGTLTPGYRYITKPNGEYRFYTIIEYNKMLYYLDIDTQKIVMAVPEAVKMEKLAKELGYQYVSTSQIQKDIHKLFQMDVTDYLHYRYPLRLSQTSYTEDRVEQEKWIKKSRKKIREE